MAALPPSRPDLGNEPHDPALSARAMENLAYIRETMEQAGAFTAVPGWGGVAMGVTALIAAYVASRQPTDHTWLRVWLIEAVLGTAIAAATMVWKSRAVSVPLLSGPGRKFALAFAPPILAGALLTASYARHALLPALPAVWLLLYGAGVVAGGSFSVRVVPVMGFCFMATGVVALFTPPGWRDVLMAIGFGLFHIVFGVVIARKHGG